MRILVFTDNYPPETNAVADRMAARAAFLVRNNCSVTVITSSPNFPEGKPYPGYGNPWLRREQKEGVLVKRVKTLIRPNKGLFLRSLDFASYVFPSFIAAIQEKAPDIVITSSPHLLVPISAIAAARWFAVPVITEIADLWPDSVIGVEAAGKSGGLIHILKAIEAIIYSNSDHLVGVTSTISMTIKERDPSAAVSTIYSGSNPSTVPAATEWREKLGLSRDDFIFAYIGTLGAAHDIPSMVKAFNQTKSARIKMIVTGKGAMRDRVEQLVRSSGNERVLLLPPLNKDEALSLLSAIDCSVIHLKDRDVFRTVLPSKLYEAMAHEKPVLAVSPAGELSEFITKHRVGRWVNAGSQTALTAEFESLASKFDELQIYRKNARSTAAHFTRDIQNQQWLELAARIVRQPC